MVAVLVESYSRRWMFYYCNYERMRDWERSAYPARDNCYSFSRRMTEVEGEVSASDRRREGVVDGG